MSLFESIKDRSSAVVIKSFLADDPLVFNELDPWGRGLHPLHLAASWGLYWIVEVLIEQGADVNQRDVSGNTALHHAAKWDDREIARMLVENGADVNACNDEGIVPLHNLAFNNGVKTARFLIEHGADVNRRWTESRNRTPLRIALSCNKQTPHTEIIDLLKLHGAK